MKAFVHKTLLIVALVLSSACLSAQADEQLSIKDLSIQCRTCHGDYGKTPMFEWWPTIGSQYSAYIANSLYAYRNGQRMPNQKAKDPRQAIGPLLMIHQVAMLSDEEILRLADYFGVDGKTRGNLNGDAPAKSAIDYPAPDENAGGGRTILLYGASGAFGKKVTKEALSAGFKVIGVSRNPARLTNEHPNFSAVAGDITNRQSTLALVSNPDIDIIVASIGGGRPGTGPKDSTQYKAAAMFADVLPELGDAAPRVIQVGGGTTLNINGQHSIDYFREKNSRTEMLFAPAPGSVEDVNFNGHYEALKLYRASEGFEWTVISPQYVFDMGPRTGRFRYSLDEMLIDEETGIGRISRADMAVALVREITAENFVNRRFTVGY